MGGDGGGVGLGVFGVSSLTRNSQVTEQDLRLMKAYYIFKYFLDYDILLKKYLQYLNKKNSKVNSQPSPPN